MNMCNLSQTSFRGSTETGFTTIPIWELDCWRIGQSLLKIFVLFTIFRTYCNKMLNLEKNCLKIIFIWSRKCICGSVSIPEFGMCGIKMFSVFLWRKLLWNTSDSQVDRERNSIYITLIVNRQKIGAFNPFGLVCTHTTYMMNTDILQINAIFENHYL